MQIPELREALIENRAPGFSQAYYYELPVSKLLRGFEEAHHADMDSLHAWTAHYAVETEMQQRGLPLPSIEDHLFLGNYSPFVESPHTNSREIDLQRLEINRIKKSISKLNKGFKIIDAQLKIVPVDFNVATAGENEKQVMTDVEIIQNKELKSYYRGYKFHLVNRFFVVEPVTE